MLFSFILKQAWKHWRVCVSEGEGKEGVHILQGARGGSRQCKSLPVCHLTPAGVMLWHIGKWGGRVDEDFNRILKRVMVAFMCVIVTYPKVTALKRHHPSPACLPHASFCLTDSLKLCLFVCSQSHFHLWRSRAKRGDDCTLGGAVLGRTDGRAGLARFKILPATPRPVILDITRTVCEGFFSLRRESRSLRRYPGAETAEVSNREHNQEASGSKYINNNTSIINNTCTIGLWKEYK